MEVINILDLTTELISPEGPEAHIEGHAGSSSFEIQSCEAYLQA